MVEDVILANFLWPTRRRAVVVVVVVYMERSHSGANSHKHAVCAYVRAARQTDSIGRSYIT